MEVVDTPRRFPRVLVGRALALLQDQVDMAAVSEVALAAEASVEATAVTVSVLGVVSVTKVVVTDLAAPLPMRRLVLVVDGVVADSTVEVAGMIVVQQAVTVNPSGPGMPTLTAIDVTMTVTVMETAIGTVTGTATATGTASASAIVTGTVAVKTMDGRGTMMMMRTMTLVPREDTKKSLSEIG